MCHCPVLSRSEGRVTKAVMQQAFEVHRWVCTLPSGPVLSRFRTTTVRPINALLSASGQDPRDLTLSHESDGLTGHPVNATLLDGRAEQAHRRKHGSGV